MRTLFVSSILVLSLAATVFAGEPESIVEARQRILEYQRKSLELHSDVSSMYFAAAKGNLVDIGKIDSVSSALDKMINESRETTKHLMQKAESHAHNGDIHTGKVFSVASSSTKALASSFYLLRRAMFGIEKMNDLPNLGPRTRFASSWEFQSEQVSTMLEMSRMYQELSTLFYNMIDAY